MRSCQTIPARSNFYSIIKEETITQDENLDMILAYVQIGVFAVLGALGLVSAIYGIYTQFCMKNTKKAKVNIDEL